VVKIFLPAKLNFAMAQAAAIQVTLGDAAAVATAQWSLDALMIPIFPQELQ